MLNQLRKEKWITTLSFFSENPLPKDIKLMKVATFIASQLVALVAS